MFEQYITKLETHLRRAMGQLILKQPQEATKSLISAHLLLNEFKKYEFYIEIQRRSGKHRPAVRMNTAFQNYHSLINQMHFLEISAIFGQCDTLLSEGKFDQAVEYYQFGVSRVHQLWEVYVQATENGLKDSDVYIKFPKILAKLQRLSRDKAAKLESFSDEPEDALAIRLVKNLTTFTTSQCRLGLDFADRDRAILNSPSRNRYSQFASSTTPTPESSNLTEENKPNCAG